MASGHVVHIANLLNGITAMKTTRARGKNVDMAGAKQRTRSAAKVRRDHHQERVTAVMARAEKSGLLAEKNDRIAGRVSGNLIRQAKARTGLRSDTDLVEFALANIALEDDFAQVFRSLQGTVDPDLELGY